MERKPVSTPLAIVFGAAICLAACANAAGVRISNADYSPVYRPNELSLYAGGDNEIRVDVTNNPFPSVPQEAFEQLVVDLMPGQALRYPITFSVDPQVEYDPARRIRVMLVFDPPQQLQSIGLCRRDDIDTAAARPSDVAADPGRIRVLGAYCQGEATVTRATGTMPRGADAESTNLAGLMSQMTQALFRDKDCPTVDPNCI